MKKTLIRRVCIAGFRILTLLAFTFFVVARTVSANYSIEGVLTYEGHGLGEPKDYKGEVFKRTFQVSVEDCKWTIKMIPIGNTNFTYSLSTYDGTNLIYLDRLTQESFNSLRSNLRHGVTNLFQSCIVESTPVPRTMASFANAYPWLAFASGCYFATVTNDSVWDIYPLNMQQSFFAGRRQIPCIRTLSAVPPYLPTRLEYKWTNLATMSLDGKILTRELPPAFRKSFVAGEFRSDEFTNISGLSFPTKFEMREYRPMPNASDSNDFRCTLIVKGAVTSISTTQHIWSNELPNELLVVNDYRFYTNSPVPSYLTSNGFISSSDNPSLASARQAAWQRLQIIKNTAHIAPPSIHVKPALIRIFLCITMVAPLLLLLWKHRSNNKTNKSKDEL